jgi:BirA family biotin operon repressor/biotin-[acetyl-CoA-carboxylase] ligase
MKADIIWLDSTDSTNDEARRRISDIDNLSVLSVLKQTSGRGQRGNTWSSTPGENLTFSIVLKYETSENTVVGHCHLPEIKAADQFKLTEITSISVIEFLRQNGIVAKIKWPNDIYVSSKKICGMLIENSVRGGFLSTSIIGIGLNINQRNFNVNIPNPTSMVLCRPEAHFDIHTCLEEFIDIFISNLERYLYPSPDDSSRTGSRKAYMADLWRLNEPAVFADLNRSCKFNGIIRNLSPIGHLQIEDTDKGELREFAFKEIGYIID